LKNKLFRRADAFVAAFVLLLAALLFLFLSPKEKGREAVVSYRGEVIDRVELSLAEPIEKSYTTKEGTVRVLFAADGVSVVSSPCHGQNCVHTSKIEDAGEGILCLPLGFSVLLSGDGALDGVTG
jgi:hypothetical protein